MADKIAAIDSRLSHLTVIKLSPILGLAALFLALWFIPAPSGLTSQTWHLFDIFICTIVGIIGNIFPMGALAIFALAIATITQTLTLKQSLSEFSSPIPWLILLAFLLARGFIKTGLGARIAYHFVSLLGKNTLGLAYGITATELFLAPFTPSNTARGAGIVYPIIQAISLEYGSCPSLKTERKLGSYLIKLAYQANVITSAMFLTASATNPLIASFTSKLGMDISWTTWALAMLVPGLLSLLVLPLILYYLYPPILVSTPEAPAFAKAKLESLGKMQTPEYIMLGTFVVLLTLWIFGPELGIEAAVAALVGLAILLGTRVLSWEDVLQENNAWHTFIWLATLLTLSKFLGEFGMISWFSGHMQNSLETLPWISALIVVAIIYFYAHYAFASTASHTGALYMPLVLVALAAGAPAHLSILVLAVCSTLCAGITHYGTGTGPVYFGADYIQLRDWWKLGGIMSLVNLSIWGTLGILWWKVLGLW